LNADDDLVRIGIAAFLVNFLLLALFLRAIVAPLYLVLASGLALAASIALLKLALRRARFLTRDPRRVAAACRRELGEFLAAEVTEKAGPKGRHDPNRTAVRHGSEAATAPIS
jgi:hypothetical protein